jgi:hypothetical protein
VLVGVNASISRWHARQSAARQSRTQVIEVRDRLVTEAHLRQRRARAHCEHPRTIARSR